ncbi:unnamed protein product [Brugia timori]|uniref:Major sperm protein n=1 Tax=Brugia timori TaxID=42155 RepID=A0A0R3QTR6_9BILA|nr:unnamed protein product [Brugia timori]
MATAPTQKGEPALSVDPETAVFLANGGKSEHMLVNISEKRLAVKVRCSDNNLFRVSPVYMFIEPGSCGNIVITRLPGPAKSDKLVFHYFVCEPNDLEPKEIFKINSQRSPEMLKMPINIISAEDVPKVRLKHELLHFKFIHCLSLFSLSKLHLCNHTFWHSTDKTLVGTICNLIIYST